MDRLVHANSDLIKEVVNGPKKKIFDELNHRYSAEISALICALSDFYEVTKFPSLQHEYRAEIDCLARSIATGLPIERIQDIYTYRRQWAATPDSNGMIPNLLNPCILYNTSDDTYHDTRLDARNTVMIDSNGQLKLSMIAHPLSLAGHSSLVGLNGMISPIYQSVFEISDEIVPPYQMLTHDTPILSRLDAIICDCANSAASYKVLSVFDPPAVYLNACEELSLRWQPFWVNYIHTSGISLYGFVLTDDHTSFRTFISTLTNEYLSDIYAAPISAIEQQLRELFRDIMDARDSIKATTATYVPHIPRCIAECGTAWEPFPVYWPVLSPIRVLSIHETHQKLLTFDIRRMTYDNSLLYGDWRNKTGSLFNDGAYTLLKDHISAVAEELENVVGHE